MEPQLKTCKGCDKTFSTKKKKQIFCTISCKDSYHNKRKQEFIEQLECIVCPHCKKVFSIKESVK